jgi:hypothetical protein
MVRGQASAGVASRCQQLGSEIHQHRVLAPPPWPAAYWTRRSTLGLATGLGVGSAFALGGYWIQVGAGAGSGAGEAAVPCERQQRQCQRQPGDAPRCTTYCSDPSLLLDAAHDAAPPCRPATQRNTRWPTKCEMRRVGHLPSRPPPAASCLLRCATPGRVHWSTAAGTSDMLLLMLPLQPACLRAQPPIVVQVSDCICAFWGSNGISRRQQPVSAWLPVQLYCSCAADLLLHLCLVCFGSNTQHCPLCCARVLLAGMWAPEGPCWRPWAASAAPTTCIRCLPGGPTSRAASWKRSAC